MAEAKDRQRQVQAFLHNIYRCGWCFAGVKGEGGGAVFYWQGLSFSAAVLYSIPLGQGHCYHHLVTGS